MNEISSGQIIEDIIQFDSELGIVGRKVNDEKIDCFKLVEDELVVVSPVSFNLPSVLSLKDLLKHDFIMRGKKLRNQEDLRGYSPKEGHRPFEP